MLEKRSASGFSPLMVAAACGSADALQALLALGARVHVKDDAGTSALHLAALGGHTACVRLLLAAGHRVDYLDNAGWPPLLYANFMANRDCVRLLLEPCPQQLALLGPLISHGTEVGAARCRKSNFSLRSSATDPPWSSSLPGNSSLPGPLG
jgi:ankyrin repeat protein